MNVTASGTPTEISLLDSLNQSWLKLPLAVMRDVGPATQTLGAIARMTTTEMYCSVRKISDMSRLPVATTRKHLVALNDKGWIDNVGREHTRAGRARRTCTIKLTAKTKSTLNDYSILPWWANGLRVGFFPWSAKAVLSVVISKLTAMKAAIERQYGTGHDTEHFWGCLEHMGGEDQFRFSLDRLHRDTGLFREALLAAKRRLAGLQIVEWADGGDRGDILYPRSDFRLVVTEPNGSLVYRFATTEEIGN